MIARKKQTCWFSNLQRNVKVNRGKDFYYIADEINFYRPDFDLHLVSKE